MMAGEGGFMPIKATQKAPGRRSSSSRGRTGFFPVLLLAGLSALAAAIGIHRLTGLTLATGLLAAGMLALVKLVFLRDSENHLAGYLALAGLSLPLTAYGFYSVGNLATPSASSWQTNAPARFQRASAWPQAKPFPESSWFDARADEQTAPNEFQRFFSEALAQQPLALACWLVPLIFEMLSFAMVSFTRPRVLIY
jgi:hypothetical protein